VVLVLLPLLLARPVFGEKGEVALGGSLMYSVVKWDSRHPSGGGAALEATYGLTDWLSLRATALATVHAAPKDEDAGLPSGALTVGGGFVGVRYVFDVLRVVPFADIGIGALVARGAGHGIRFDLGVDVGLGVDYLYSRRVTFGLAVRYHAFATDMGTLPVYLTVGPRVGLRWD